MNLITAKNIETERLLLMVPIVKCYNNVKYE